MEQLRNNIKTPQKNFFSDPSHRMPHRPAAIKPGEGQGFHNFGTSFVLPKPQVKYGKASKSKFKPTGTHKNIHRRATSSVPDDESDDELLLSSQNSMDANATPSSKRVMRGKESTISFDDVEIVRVDGRDLPAHPDFQPSTLNAVKGLRFKKNRKDLPATDSVIEGPPQSSSLDDSQDLFKPISDDIEIIDGPPPSGPSSRQKSSEAFSTRQSGPSITKSPARRSSDGKVSKQSPSVKKIPGSPPKPRPRPRPYVVIARKRNESTDSTPRTFSAQQKRDLPLRTKSPEQPVTVDEKRTAKKPTLPPFSRREPQEFPMSLQAKENVSDSARSGDASSTKAKKNTISRSGTFVNAPKPIPLPSPLGTKQVSRGSTFPNISSLTSSKGKGKSKARSESSDEDDVDLTDSPVRLSGPKPFPMSSQVLATIDKRPNSPSCRTPSFTKRTSSDDTIAEQGRSPKKHKDSSLGVLGLLDRLDEPMEEDSIDLGYARDPSKMCPYCDEDLPSHPTPLLRHLLTTARKKSVSDPRPRNRGGMRAPTTVYISVCQRHRFESRQLPIAEQKGWPKTIDFNRVPARVKKMKEELEAIILDKDDASDTEDLDLDKGPRSKSVFWIEVKKEVKKQGSRVVAGVKGQFASFEKTQPGYYGEQGSVIIHQTLFDLFPPSTFDASLIMPLTPAEFIQRVLVPETGVRLIAQDLGLKIEDAIETLRESAQYGVAMFPDTNENKRKGTSGSDDDEMDVADKIVMERARARRKELAEEEKIEKEMMDVERAAQRAKARESRREKAVERAQQARQGKGRAQAEVTREASQSEVSEANVGSGTRRRTTQRPGTGKGESETDAMSVDSGASRRPMRTAKKGTRAIKATSQLDDSDNDSMGLFGTPKLKTSRRNGTRERSVVPDAQFSTKPAASRERKKPLGEFGWLDSGEEQESTPRPLAARQRVTDDAAKTVTLGSVLPLQIARNRPGASGPVDSNNVDSDASSLNQRLDRPRIRKGRPLAPWPMGSPSSSDRSE